LSWKAGGAASRRVRAPLSGPYPCGMIATVQQEALSERG
jgi:hypothetical protein